MMAVLNTTRQSPVHGTVGSGEPGRAAAARATQGPQGPPTPLRLWVLPAVHQQINHFVIKETREAALPASPRKPTFQASPRLGSIRGVSSLFPWPGVLFLKSQACGLITCSTANPQCLLRARLGRGRWYRPHYGHPSLDRPSRDSRLSSPGGQGGAPGPHTFLLPRLFWGASR